MIPQKHHRLARLKETFMASRRDGHASLTTGQLLKLVFAVSLLLLLGLWYFLFGPSRSLHGSAYNTNLHAVWAEHAWVDTPHTAAEIRQFVELLGGHGVKYVFLHVGPIESDGLIPPERYKELGEFLTTARAYGDRIAFLPWMGQLRGKLPLERTGVRRNIVTLSKMFVNEYGMAGIHFDIEPIRNGDSDFLFLLEDVKKAIGSDKILSVAVEEYVPKYVHRIATKLMGVGDFLTKEYLERVDAVADQIAVMTYENSIRYPRVYQYFMRQEVIWMTRLLKHARLLIGIPTYDKASETFHPEAENIVSGLKGVTDGLNNWKSRNDVFEGVALYGAWTTDRAEWNMFKEYFLTSPDAR